MKMVVRILVLCCLMFVSLAPSYATGQFFFFENPLLGKQVPDFTLDTTMRKKVNLNEFRSGNKAVVFFWATWCPHCRDQLHELNAKAQELEGKGIKVVLIDLGEGSKEVTAFLNREKVKMEVFLDEKSAVAEAYGIIGVPTFFFVDQQGVVQAVEHSIPENFEGLLENPADQAKEVSQQAG